MSNEPCPHCQNIRTTGEVWIAYARIRFHGLKEEGETTANEFVDYFNNMCDLEFKELQYANPIEPKSFDEAYDFRAQMKNGE